MADPTARTDPVTEANLDAWFAYHPATPVTGPKHDAIRKGCRELAQLFAETIPPGADRTAALRALREAMYAANAAIAVGHAGDSAG